MINDNKFKTAYVDLYKELRKYLWEPHVLDLIVDIELNCNSAIPDRAALKLQVNNLFKDVSDLFLNDESLKDTYNALKDLAYSDEDSYVKLVNTAV